MVSYVKLVEIVNGIENRVGTCTKDNDVYDDLCNILSNCFFKLLDLGLNEYSECLIENAIASFMYKIAFYSGKNKIEMLDLFIVLKSFLKKQFN